MPAHICSKYGNNQISVALEVRCRSLAEVVHAVNCVFGQLSVAKVVSLLKSVFKRETFYGNQFYYAVTSGTAHSI